MQRPVGFYFWGLNKQIPGLFLRLLSISIEYNNPQTLFKFIKAPTLHIDLGILCFVLFGI